MAQKRKRKGLVICIIAILVTNTGTYYFSKIEDSNILLIKECGEKATMYAEFDNSDSIKIDDVNDSVLQLITLDTTDIKITVEVNTTYDNTKSDQDIADESKQLMDEAKSTTDTNTTESEFIELVTAEISRESEITLPLDDFNLELGEIIIEDQNISSEYLILNTTDINLTDGEIEEILNTGDSNFFSIITIQKDKIF